MIGIIMAGGNGTRLFPLTQVVNKHLLPIYDKPMIYYPLTTLMKSGVRDIVVICGTKFKEQFKQLLGDGSQWGLNINILTEDKAKGIANAFLIAEDYIKDRDCKLILGDNVFYSTDKFLKSSIGSSICGAKIFAYRVSDPERYGVVKFDENKKVTTIEEKPIYHLSNYAVTGIYSYDNTVLDRTKELRPSARYELEITDLNNSYLHDDLLSMDTFPEGTAWLDTGTHASLIDASNFVKTIEDRQGIKFGCPYSTALKLNFINSTVLYRSLEELPDSPYREDLILRRTKENF